MFVPSVRALRDAYLEDRVADQTEPVWLAARGAVETVGLVFGGGNLARRVLFGNYDFGIDPFARRALDQKSSLDWLAP